MECGAELRLVYEAGPCGYVIYRHLRERGLHCTVVSPASVPKRPADRVKTDRRDARTLALQHRAGALRALYVASHAVEGKLKNRCEKSTILSRLVITAVSKLSSTTTPFHLSICCVLRG